VIKLVSWSGFSQNNSNERSLSQCIAKEGGRWVLFVAEKRNRIWKGKSADWLRNCSFSEATAPVMVQVIRALMNLQTRKGLYRVVIAAHFWAHYD